MTKYPDYISPPVNTRVFALLSDFSGGFAFEKDISSLPANTAKQCLNFKSEPNSLTSAIGLAELDFAPPQNTVALYFLDRLNTYFAIDSDGKLYSRALTSSAESFTAVTDAVFTATPEVFQIKTNGVFAGVFSAPGNPLIIWSSATETYSVISDTDLSSAVIFDGKLFALSHDSTILSASKNTELSEWNFTEKITLDLSEIGNLQKAVVTGSSLAIFGKHGIARIGAYSDTLSADIIYLSMGDIIPKTICSVGSGIFFATQNAVYYYNGLDSVKKLRTLSLSPQAFAFSEKRGYRLISKNLSYLIDPFTYNIVLCNLSGEAVCGCALPNASLYIPTISSKLLLLNESGVIVNTRVSGKWISPLLFYDCGIVRLHSIILRCSCPVTITVHSGDYKKTLYTTPSKEGNAKAEFNLVGKAFSVELTSPLSEKTLIRSAYIEYSPLGGAL